VKDAIATVNRHIEQLHHPKKTDEAAATVSRADEQMIGHKKDKKKKVFDMSK
jgi:hypothetical protein